MRTAEQFACGICLRSFRCCCLIRGFECIRHRLHHPGYSSIGLQGSRSAGSEAAQQNPADASKFCAAGRFYRSTDGVLSAEAGNGRHHWLRSRYPTFPALWEFCLYPCLEPRPNSSKIAESPFLTWNCESGPILQPRAKRQARSRASSPSRRQSLKHTR